VAEFRKKQCKAVCQHKPKVWITPRFSREEKENGSERGRKELYVRKENSYFQNPLYGEHRQELKREEKKPLSVWKKRGARERGNRNTDRL